MKIKIDKSIYYRIMAAIILFAVLAVLYSAQNGGPKNLSNQYRKEINAAAIEIDREVDSLLSRLIIEKSDIKIQQYLLPETNLFRIERRVFINQNVSPLQINKALNIMAQRYNAKAIGSENLKEKSVNIHIKIENVIVESIIFKFKSNQESATKKDRT